MVYQSPPVVRSESSSQSILMSRYVRGKQSWEEIRKEGDACQGMGTTFVELIVYRSSEQTTNDMHKAALVSTINNRCTCRSV